MPNNIYNHNLSDKEYKFSYWFVTHKLIIRRVGIVVLALIAGGLLIGGVYGLSKYYLTDYEKNAAVERSLGRVDLDQAVLAELNQPKPLQILGTTVIKSGDNSYDMMAEIINPNQQWFVESFEYSFSAGNVKTDVIKDFILPVQEKYVMKLNFASETSMDSAQINIQNVKWSKVANYLPMKEKFLQIDFANKAVLFSGKSFSKTGNLSQISFDIINKSAYSYWNPVFKVFVYKSEKLIAVNQLTLNKLNTGEKSTQVFNLFQNIAPGSKIEVVPDINILDPAIFKGFDNQIGEVK